MASGAGVAAGLSAAVVSGAGEGDGRAPSADAAAVPASASFGAADESVARGSRLRTARTGGLTASSCSANLGSGGARQEVLVAKSSWAARIKAVAPSPKTSTDMQMTIAANRKRKPGSIDKEKFSALAVICRGLSHWERGDHRPGGVRGVFRAAANQA